MFPPENHNGNIEYKRHLCSNEIDINDENNLRFQQLVTQLKYRLNEGDGFAIYYLGVNDNGTIYNLTNEEKNNSLKVLKKMILKLNGKITKLIYNTDYIQVIIKDYVSSLVLTEKRVLLLGDTGSGKTTFLSYLIKNKMDTEFCEARLFILNHKHELETGRTSSFNYQYKNHNNKKIVFFDTPGELNNKIRNKILLSINFDLIIFFDKPNQIWNKKELYIKYADNLSIPYISINLFNIKSDINLIDPMNNSNMLKIIEKNFKNKEENKNMNVKFYLLQSYPHIELGWILSGYLSSGKLIVGQNIFWYDDNKVEVKINSIYVNNTPVQNISAPVTVTITLNNIRDINNKPRYGFLSNKNYHPINDINLKWIFYNDKKILEEPDITINVMNQNINLKKNKNNYKINQVFNIKEKYFIYEKNNYFGYGIII